VGDPALVHMPEANSVIGHVHQDVVAGQNPEVCDFIDARSRNVVSDVDGNCQNPACDA
jgi:hypothetical protein